MTLVLVLGLVAGLYLLWLMVRLASFALPLYVGLGAGLWLLHHDDGYLAAIVVGFLASVITLVAGHLAFGLTRSPTLRSAIALIFVLPAGLAGYQLVQGLAGLMISSGIALTILSAVGGALIARSAWTQLVAPSWAKPRQQLVA